MRGVIRPFISQHVNGAVEPSGSGGPAGHTRLISCRGRSSCGTLSSAHLAVVLSLLRLKLGLARFSFSRAGARP